MSWKEQMKIEELKNQEPDRWSHEAWAEATRRFHQPEPPRVHLILLKAPLGTPEMIQQVAGLSEIPTIERTTTFPEQGKREETVSFCRVDDDGYCKISDWMGRSPDLFRTYIFVMFEGQRKAAWVAVPPTG